jgi:excisionase family DNA binding protein
MESLMNNPELIKNARFEISGNDLVTLAKTLATELSPKTPEKKEADEILTVEQTCKLLGISRVTLYEWNRTGTLQHRKIGRRVYYYRSDIDKILKNR